MSRGSHPWIRHHTGSATLRGRAAVITGADTRVGRAVAVLFAFEGADVTAIHGNRPADAEVTKSLVERAGGRCLVLDGDVASERFCRRAVDHAIDAFGSLDVLVNNAAVDAPFAALGRSGANRSMLAARAVLRGYSNMTHAAIRYREGGGAILNRVVQADTCVSVRQAAEVSAQAQIHRFTRETSSLLRPRGSAPSSNGDHARSHRLHVDS